MDIDEQNNEGNGNEDDTTNNINIFAQNSINASGGSSVINNVNDANNNNNELEDGNSVQSPTINVASPISELS